MIGFNNVSDVTVKEQKKNFCNITAGNQASCPTDQGMYGDILPLYNYKLVRLALV